MRRILIAALCLIMCISLSACAVESVADSDEQSVSAFPISSLTDGKVVLFDTEECSLSVSEVRNDLPKGVTFEVIMENKSDRDLTFRVRTVAVNGWQIPCFGHETVEAGNTVQYSLECDPKPYPVPIDSVDSVLMQWEVIYADDLSLPPLVEDIFAFSASGLAFDEVEIPERPAGSNEYAFIDDELFAFAAMDIYYDGFYDSGQFGTDMLCYIENKTDTTVRTEIDNVIVNGWALNSFDGSHHVMPGCRSYFLVTLDPINLELCGIEKIDQLSFDFIIQDTGHDELASHSVTMYHTGLTADDIPAPEHASKPGETVLVDDDLCTVVIEPLLREDNFFTYGLYLNNKTNKIMEINLDDLIVNGDAEILFYEYFDLQPGSHIYIPIYFYDFEYAYYGADEPESIEFRLEVICGEGLFEKTVFDQTVTVKN